MLTTGAPESADLADLNHIVAARIEAGLADAALPRAQRSNL